MPGRRKKIYTNGVYHVFNKTINSYRIFGQQSNASLFLRTIQYYRSTKTQVSLSHLSELSKETIRTILIDNSREKYFRVRIYAYCLMPTHYHFLVEQIKENGVSNFISNSINSFTRHFNIQKERQGPIFLTKFKAVPIMTDEQLIHVSRYIHLNPFSSGIVTQINDLENYPWSSYNNYLKGVKGFANPSQLLKMFDNKPERYRKFVEDNADYQKTLELNKKVHSWI